jgi:hypothetical protein
MLLSKVMKRVVVGTFAVVGSVVFAQNVPVGKASEAAFKIELGNLLKISVGNTLVNRARQMAVCCCLHTKGDGITADYIPPPVMSDPAQKPKDGGS